MQDLKWIKLDISMFEDEKIKLIEQMPEADTILIIWVKLLAQAGKTNANGYIYLNENIPYTEEMLSTVFDRSLNTVRLALKTLREFGMIQIDEESFIQIINWEKHQNVDGMERARKLNADRNKRYRERKKKQKLLEEKDNNVSVTSCDGTEEEVEKEKEEENISTTNKNVIEFYEKNFGGTSPYEQESILEWINDLGGDLVIVAMKRAIKRNKKSWGYTERILKSWQKNNIITVEQANAEEQAYRNQFQNRTRKSSKQAGSTNDGYNYGF
ncbi:phage replisome organizer N-terminal domain-containing protein [Lentibacillus sp. CBA3610]|uniref:phage replisome organizer N-terminal domain-containing protein n=1 Tax=Lentibacillus sp. CBA3610 TaxID=2518176 RepID=UPI00159539BD|nr:phage replisome organizer N-terminal domain-containing protein [Lentibacillus sp. CBA3610]QKY71317.1 DnaD domain protein [Lentibacillus sp. CBA3610]